MKHFCSLSEAIREGAKMNPQCFSVYANDGATCALGAAVTAIGSPEILAIGWPMEFLWNQFPYISRLSAECPVDECQTCAATEFLGVIAHINDEHRWTREQIADWLETEEEKIGYVTLSVESESSSESLQTVLSV